MELDRASIWDVLLWNLIGFLQRFFSGFYQGEGFGFRFQIHTGGSREGMQRSLEQG